MIYQVFHKLQILYFLETVSSLLSQSLNSLLLVSLVIDSSGFGGGLFCGTRYSGSIPLLGISIIGFDILGSIPLLMMIGLDVEVPCLGSEGDRAFLLTPALP